MAFLCRDIRAAGLTFLVVSALAACAKSPTEATRCTESSECLVGTSCQGGYCEYDIVVRFLSPTGTVHTRGLLPIAVEVTGGLPEEVSLLVDGSAETSLPATMRYEWDSSASTEGTHSLVARATLAGRNYDSEPIAVVVDRTAPTIVSRIPASGASNVWSRDLIQVTFSEPLSPGSLTDLAVVLGQTGGGALGKTLALSPDGLTLTVTPASLPAVPNTLQLTLSGVTDLAGNSLAPASWSWNLPDWQDLASPIVATARNWYGMAFLAVNHQGNPTVHATAVSSGSYFSSWDGAQWVDLPTGYPSVPAAATRAALAITAGGVTVLATTRNGAVLVSSLGNGTWTETAGLQALGQDWLDRAIDVVTDGERAIVTWAEDRPGGGYAVYARRWDGLTNGISSWPLLSSTGNAPVASPVSAPTQVRISHGNGEPLRVSWLEAATPAAKSFRWDGATWSADPLAACSLYSGYIAARIDPLGRSVMLLPSSDDATKLVVERCAPGVAGYGPVWLQLPVGGVVNGGSSASTPSDGLIEFDPFGNPVVAWEEGGSIIVKRWDGSSAWESLGAPLGQNVGLSILSVGPSGVVAVLWRSYGNLYVARYNR